MSTFIFCPIKHYTQPVTLTIIWLQQLVNCWSPVLNYVALLEVSFFLSCAWFNRCGNKFLVSRDSFLISRPIISFCEGCYLLKLSFSANDNPGWHWLNRSSGSDISWQYLKVSKIDINNVLVSHLIMFNYALIIIGMVPSSNNASDKACRERNNIVFPLVCIIIWFFKC